MIPQLLGAELVLLHVTTNEGYEATGRIGDERDVILNSASEFDCDRPRVPRRPEALPDGESVVRRPNPVGYSLF